MIVPLTEIEEEKKGGKKVTVIKEMAASLSALRWGVSIVMADNTQAVLWSSQSRSEEKIGMSTLPSGLSREA